MNLDAGLSCLSNTGWYKLASVKILWKYYSDLKADDYLIRLQFKLQLRTVTAEVAVGLLSAPCLRSSVAVPIAV